MPPRGCRLVDIPAGQARVVVVRQGDVFDVVSPEGPQVGDMWSFALPRSAEHLSMEHTRQHLARLVPRVGDSLVTNLRRPILTILEDTSGGHHDMLLPACDAARHALLGHVGHHRSCSENLAESMPKAEQRPDCVPSPFNIFERVLVGDDGSLEIQPPTCPPGGRIRFAAEIGQMIIISACPQDIAPTNGADRRPKPLRIEWLEWSAGSTVS